MIKINVVSRRGKRFFVAKDKNKIIATRKVEGSKLNKQSATNIFRRNNTFFQDRKKSKIVLSNTTEYTTSTTFKPKSYSETQKRSLIKSNPRIRVQYFVKFFLKNNNSVVARSTQRTNPSNKARKEMRNEAYENALERLSKVIKGNVYDIDDGIEVFDKVIKIEEGYIWYRLNQRSKATS